jgi:hypothetical protein
VLQTPDVGHTFERPDDEDASILLSWSTPDPSTSIARFLDRCVLARQHSGNQVPVAWSFGSFFLSMEISLIATAITRAQNSVRNDIAVLRYDLQPPQQAHWILATRSRARRLSLKQLRTRMRLCQDRLWGLPADERQFQTNVSRQSLENIEELLSMLDEFDRAIQELRDEKFRTLQIELTTTQITESRKAIKQADTVARLTILAFIYIPTSCVCGVFGMNLVETPDGFSAWIFGVTLAVVLITTLAIALGGRLYILTAQLSFYLLKRLIYNYWRSTSDRSEKYIYMPLKRLVQLPEKVGKAFRNGRESLLSYIEKGRQLEAPDDEYKMQRELRT